MDRKPSTYRLPFLSRPSFKQEAAQRLGTLVVCLLAMCSLASAHPHKVSAIENECKQLQAALVGTTPFVFSGPDPWTEIDELPASMPDDAVAYVYTAGAQIRWVFIRILDSESGWSEDINYFYRNDGTLAKRVRHVQSAAANMTVEVVGYYAGGQLLKESTHHHSLTPGHQDTSEFSDPDAPVFPTTSDLPFPAIMDLWRRLS